MNVLETYSERLVQGLERRKTRLPYGLVWCLLGLAGAFFVFGLVDRTWAYLVEGSVAFVAAGSRWGQPDGQIMFLFILAKAASEVAVGLALVLRLYHHHHNLDADAISDMRG